MKIVDYLSYQIIQEENETYYNVYFTEENLNKLLNDLNKFSELKNFFNKENSFFMINGKKLFLFPNKGVMVKYKDMLYFTINDIFSINDLKQLYGFKYKPKIIECNDDDWLLMKDKHINFEYIIEDWLYCGDFVFCKIRNDDLWSRLRLEYFLSFNFVIIGKTEQTMIMLKE